MEIEAIPTEYCGVTFRSKLEATWARFFDVIGVEWEYEPCQLAGWIPDFLIAGWWLAEVKPMDVPFGCDALNTPFAKAVRDFDTVLLGDGPTAALGSVVRRGKDGRIFSRHLLADISDTPATLHVAAQWPTDFQCPLPEFWRGVVESHETWRAVPFRRAVIDTIHVMLGGGQE